MPDNTNLQKIMIIGSGPFLIGQAGEYSYAIVQVCKALKDESREVIFIDNNPVNLAAVSSLADLVYSEPLTVENLEKIIAAERPDGLLTGFGGQNALNLGYFLAGKGILEQYQVKMLGFEAEAIENTENRAKFRELMQELGLLVPEGLTVTSAAEGIGAGQRLGFPVVLRSSFAPEGAGVMVAYNKEELEDFLAIALNFSPIRQVMLEKSLAGWKEFEFEVIRDSTDKCMIISSLENIDSVGVHTGDSMVALPAQSLSTAEYTSLAEICKKVIKRLRISGVANLQIAQNPVDGAINILEVNPRFTKSSALAAKATGFQIPAVAAKLGLGLSIAELFAKSNQLGEKAFQPVIDYIAVKLPRFNFEKFPGADQTLGTTTKSVGEVMAFGHDFKEAFQKAIRSLMVNRYGFGADGRDVDETKLTAKEIREKIANPNPERLFYLRYALKQNMPIPEIANLSKLSTWFLNELAELTAFEKKLTTYAIYNLTPEVLLQAKKWGFSDVQLAYLLRTTEDEVRSTRLKTGIKVGYVPVEPAEKPAGAGGTYFFGTYNPESRKEKTAAGEKQKILITGVGPNRIGLGPEFNYSIIRAALTATDMGMESIIVDCNPTAVSTDPANAAKLYFEPLTKEDLLNIVAYEGPVVVMPQFSGKASLNLVNSLQETGVKIPGTPQDSYNRCTSWNLLKELAQKLGLILPGNATAADYKGALEAVNQTGFPVVVKPSFPTDKPVEILYDLEELKSYVDKARGISGNNPLIIEKFLDDAIGVIVESLSDGKDLVTAGIIEQIEEAGLHPGDCACALPPFAIGKEIIAKIKANTSLLAHELQVKGLFTVHYAVKHDTVYLLEINPFPGLFTPFICRATGVDWIAAATKVMLGVSIAEQGVREATLKYTAVKEVVLPFTHFPEVDTLLGPEMRSTGAVMGIDDDFGLAFIKSQLAAGVRIPTSGTIFMSIRDEDRRFFTAITRQLLEMGFQITAFEETAAVLNRNNLPCQSVYKVGEGRPNIIDRIKNGEIQWIISISSGRKTRQEEIAVRSAAVQRDIPITTTLSGSQVAVTGLERYLRKTVQIKPIRG
ncbi:MAG: carbamoyl-phosphate synthase large subunit [Bacillota bacterium]